MMDLTIVVPIIVALVEVAKRSGLNSKWAPALSVALGLVALGLWGGESVLPNLLEGLVAGLAASGVYSGVKATITR